MPRPSSARAHFHKAALGDVDEGFARLIRCDEDERQEIRHAYLAVQRESGWVLRDSMTQRVAMYLVIARNRMRDAHAVSMAPDELEALRTSPLFAVAQEVFSVLAGRFDGFFAPEGEVAALALLLLCNLDLSSERDVCRLLPSVLEGLAPIRERALSEAGATLGLDLATCELAAPAFDQGPCPAARRAPLRPGRPDALPARERGNLPGEPRGGPLRLPHRPGPAWHSGACALGGRRWARSPRSS